MKRYIYLIAILLGVSFTSIAQNEERKYCGASQLLEDALQDPEKQQILDQLEIFTQEFVTNLDNARRSGPCDGGPCILPVVVHVIHNYGNENISYEQIDNGIMRINEDFNGLNDDIDEVIDSFAGIIGTAPLELRLATKDPDGNCTYGVTRTATKWTEESGPKVMSLVNWPSDQYINIYVVRTFDYTKESAAAYATYPGTGGDNGDYIFCRYDYFGDWNVFSDTGPTGSNWSRHTMPHEVGHFFNLAHPWGSTNEPGVEGNCISDDNVEDTPNTIGTDGNEVGCPLDQVTCESLDNVQNIMDYAACSHMFTQGQADRVIAALNSEAGFRNSLWQPSNLAATGTDDDSYNNEPYAECLPVPEIASDMILGCAGSEIDVTSYVWNYRNANIEYTWDFPDGEVIDEDNNTGVATVSYSQEGTYDITLEACIEGTDLCQERTFEDYVVVVSSTEPDQLFTDIDGDGTSNWEDDDIDGDGTDNEDDNDIDGDGIEDDDDTSPDGTVLVFSESFEQSFPQVNSTDSWFLKESTIGDNWDITDVASSKGNQSLRIRSQNHGTRTVGAVEQRYRFSTPEIDLSEFYGSDNNDAMQICFDYAYARRLPYKSVDLQWEDSAGNFVFDADEHVHPSIHHDDLLISFATCDAVTDVTERPRLSTRPGWSDAIGANLAKEDTLWTTDDIIFNEFVPTSSQWKQKCIDINPVFGGQLGPQEGLAGFFIFDFISTGYEEPNELRDRFELEDTQYMIYANDSELEIISASTIGGNWMYLDNIKIGNKSQVNDEYIESRSNIQHDIGALKVSPNPSKIDEGWLSFDIYSQSDVTITMVNVLGLDIGKETRTLSKGLHNFKLSDLFKIPSKGSYFVVVETSKFRRSQMVIIN